MAKKPLNTDFLRADGQIVLPRRISLYEDLDDTLEAADIQVANVSDDLRALYCAYCSGHRSDRDSEEVVLNVGTMRQRMPDGWLAAFYYWAGIRTGSFLSAVALQSDGRPGILLTNGKLNGSVLSENPQYAVTCRWHDPTRPYPKQTATFPELGWSFNLVPTSGREWCPQGGKILYV
jgi:hypothetical protein